MEETEGDEAAVIHEEHPESKCIAAFRKSTPQEPESGPEEWRKPVTKTEVGRDQAKRPGEERREILMGVLPMLIVFALWLFAQAWLVGPLLFR